MFQQKSTQHFILKHKFSSNQQQQQINYNRLLSTRILRMLRLYIGNDIEIICSIIFEATINLV